jgi:hypothetical protein
VGIQPTLVTVPTTEQYSLNVPAVSKLSMLTQVLKRMAHSRLRNRPIRITVAKPGRRPSGGARSRGRAASASQGSAPLGLVQRDWPAA